MPNMEIDEAWIVNGPSPEAQAALNRLSKRSRTVRPPAGLVDGEAYRTWLLERVTASEAIDVTNEEHKVTAEWKERITSAPTDELWSEYIGQPH